VDALGGMVSAAEGRLGASEPGLRDALANLRMTFADVAQDAGGGAPRVPPEPGPEAGPRSEDPGILRPPSGLWVPGQD
jgi:hypothetical protein